MRRCRTRCSPISASPSSPSPMACTRPHGSRRPPRSSSTRTSWLAREHLRARLLGAGQDAAYRRPHGDSSRTPWSPHRCRADALGDPNVLDKDRLTIGFARRFATYKRANLIFTEPDTLAAILDAGAQIIFAGKAHPRDVPGQELIAEIIRWSEDPRFKGKIVFVLGYDPRWGRLLTTGSDVWLNNPRRPREASERAARRRPSMATQPLGARWLVARGCRRYERLGHPRHHRS